MVLEEENWSDVFIVATKLSKFGSESETTTTWLFLSERFQKRTVCGRRGESIPDWAVL